MRTSRIWTGLAVMAMAAGGVVSIEGAAAAGEGSNTVVVHGSAAGLKVVHASAHAGQVRFKLDTTVAAPGNTDVQMFRPKPGKTVEAVLSDLAEEFSQKPATAAKGTRDLVADGRFYGLAAVVKGTPVVITQNLNAGTYYLFDINAAMGGGKPPLTTVRITGRNDGDDDSGHHTTVRLTSKDRFSSPNVLPAAGTITVRNVADTIHFMNLAPVQPGTTDKDVQAAFDHPTQGPPPFALDGPSIQVSVQSPGWQADITYRLPKGTYVMLCFVADDKDGMPHAFMGMHKVVTLR